MIHQVTISCTKSEEKKLRNLYQVAAGSNQKSLLFTGHIDGVDNIFSEKFWLLFSKANKLKINVN